MLKNLTIMLLLALSFKASAQYENQVPNGLGQYSFDIHNLTATANVSIVTDTIRPFYSNGKFYYKNILSDKLLFNDGFYAAYPFCKNYAVVKTGYNMYEIIDKTGKVIIKPEYGENGGFYLDQFSPTIVLGEHMLNYLTGDLSNYTYQGCTELSPGNGIYKNEGKYGILFRDGHKTPAKYDTVLSADFCVVKVSGKIGVVNKYGDFFLPLVYDDYKTGYPDRFALKKGKNWNYYQNGKLVFSSKKNLIDFTYDDKIIFKSGNYYGCMDNFGTQILKPIYRWISVTSPVAINEKNQLIFYSKDKQDFVYYTFTKE